MSDTCTETKLLKSELMQITPFRFVGSTAMMKRLRTSSSPFMQVPEGSATSQGSESVVQKGIIGHTTLEKLKANGPLLPLVPIPGKVQVKKAARTSDHTPVSALPLKQQSESARVRGTK